ncbi:hypothetical protein ACLB2K_047384 [Fragaria x ananassa]
MPDPNSDCFGLIEEIRFHDGDTIWDGVDVLRPATSIPVGCGSVCGLVDDGLRVEGDDLGLMGGVSGVLEMGESSGGSTGMADQARVVIEAVEDADVAADSSDSVSNSREIPSTIGRRVQSTLCEDTKGGREEIRIRNTTTTRTFNKNNIKPERDGAAMKLWKAFRFDVK